MRAFPFARVIRDAVKLMWANAVPTLGITGKVVCRIRNVAIWSL